MTELRKKLLWKRSKSFLHDYQLILVGVLVFSAILLGVLGFAEHFPEDEPFWNILYYTVQLFVLQLPSDVPGINNLPENYIDWKLQLARWLALIVFGYAAVAAFLLICSEQLRWLKFRLFTRDHVVICGLGRKGLLLTQMFRGRGDRVVVIEKDKDNNLLERCRDQGALTLIGDAADAEILEKVRVQKAKCIVSVCGDDGANAEVAARACELVKARKRGVLSCYIHIADSKLWDMLRERDVTASQGDWFRPQFFNVFDGGARAVLNEFRPFDETCKDQTAPAHLVVIGLGHLGERLVVHAARKWWNKYADENGNRLPAPDAGRLRITVIDGEGKLKEESLRLRYPQLGKVCDLVSHQADVQSPEFQRLALPDATIIYACLDDDARSVSAALAIFQRVRGRGIPIVVCTDQDVGLSTFLHRTDSGKAEYDSIHSFALLDKACNLNYLFGGTNEILARAIHEKYRRDQKKSGQTPGTNPSMVDWDGLPENIKESNRRQADHISKKLDAVGCAIAPLNDWGERLFEFPPEEVEKLARMEHTRWTEERRLEGWTYDQTKNLEKKTSPYLVDWELLSESIKDYDRNPVRELPAFLAGAGFRIYRAR